MSNRQLVEDLDAAEKTGGSETETEGMEVNEGESGSKENDLSASSEFQRDQALALASSSSNRSQAQEKIFKEFEIHQHDPPASSIIKSSLPAPVVRFRAERSLRSLAPAPGSSDQSEPSGNDRRATKQEIRFLLEEWTSTTKALMRDYLEDSPDIKDSEEPGKSSETPQR